MRSAVGARSEAVRAKRRKHARNAYKGKDKPEVIARLTAEQKGRCKVCGCEGAKLGDGTVGLVLDHCHATGRPRAMLCGPCNAALGLLGESPTRIKAPVGLRPLMGAGSAAADRVRCEQGVTGVEA